MVPKDGGRGHDGCQNRSAHSLVGVACGRDEYGREKKEVIVMSVANEY